MNGALGYIDSLYFGDTCCEHHHFNNASVTFSTKVLEEHLRKLYNGFDTDKGIEATAWREVLRIMNEGVVEGLSNAKEPPTHATEFYRAIKHSNAVFSAFKVHAMDKEMARRLYDGKGNLKTYAEWREDIAGIASHHTGAWLRTEYNTAVARAHFAAEWKEFERNKDVMPNLRWMPTTSPHPDVVHRKFWEKKLTLPIEHPFWKENHPGNRWNCSCMLQATDEPANPEVLGEMVLPVPAKGLENNPGTDGVIINDTHPYFPSSCGKCPFYKPTLKNRLQHLFSNKKKDCNNCPYINNALDDIKIAEGEKYQTSKEYGDRFQISIKADPTDLEDNKRVAKALLESFPNIQVKIRPDYGKEIHGKKNPEFIIDGMIADNKRIKGEQGITNGFKKALSQGCKAVIIDLDSSLKSLNVKKVSQHIDWRKADFAMGKIKSCYVVFNNKAIVIDRLLSRDEIKEVLKKLKS